MISYRERIQEQSGVGKIFVLNSDDIRLDDSEITHLMKMK